ncbi:MAG: DUF371 domain-containing protein [Thermoproteota archaeon]|nr:DUF371 domain-containing protein [Thermoproteota archaeon]
MVQEDVIFYGHPNVQSLHAKTIEITKEEHLTLRGDCIIGVRADKSCVDLDEQLKHKLKSNSAIVRIEVIAGNNSFLVTGAGDQRLDLLSPHDIVIRKTNFVCPRTMSVRCDKASQEIPRDLVKTLQDRDKKAIFRITVE